MTRKEAELEIETLSMRIFEIEDVQQHLKDEKQQLRARIEELEWVVDPIAEPIIPHLIVSVGV